MISVGFSFCEGIRPKFYALVLVAMTWELEVMIWYL